MKKIDLHQDIVLSFENWLKWFSDKSKVVDIHWSYAGNYNDYLDNDLMLVWSANWPYHLEWNLSDIESRKITYDKNNIEKRHIIMENLADSHDIGIIKKKEDLKKMKKLNIIHHIEWIDHVKSIGDIEKLYDLWVRSIGFVWNFDNFLCSNNTNFNGNWLTKLGREVVKFMNNKWMIIDTAHMNHESMMDVVKFSEKPIINSHSNLKSFHNHTRNVEDEFIRMIVKNNWVLWLSVYNGFISPNNKAFIEDYIQQIKYVTDIAWEDHVALWTDFHWLITKECVKWLQNISDLNNLEEIIIREFWVNFAQKFFYDNSMRILESNLD